MKLIIDIPEDVYKRTVFYREFKDLNDCVKTIKALENGTPLPKGHGRLIDERQITECKQVGLVIQDGVVTRCLVTDAPTIIEADKESEE